ncbi:MAG: response regulator, partial [Pseudomonadota bacterium]
NILIVDDDEFILRSLELMLQNSSYKVLSTTSATRAINILELNNIDLIITDIMMPDQDGMTLISLIRDKLNLDIPIIIISGDQMNYKAENMFNFVYYFACDFIQKPIHKHQLLDAINYAFNFSAEKALENLQF